MRTAPRLALVILPLVLAACSKDSGRNSVWLAVSNETGRDVRNLSLVCGKTSRFDSTLSAGHTQGSWVRTPKPQPLSISYTDDTGTHKAPDLGAEVSPNLIGGRVLITLRADGTVDRLDEPRSGPPPGFSDRLDDYAGWIVGALCLLGIPPLVLFIRKTKAAAQNAGARLKELASKTVAAATAPESPEELRDSGSPGATQLAAASALGLTRKVCLIPMFRNASSAFWHEGTFNGRMLGLLDHGALWLGGIDEETLYDFSRPNATSPFQGTAYVDLGDNAILRDEEIARILARFSSAVREAHILANAVEALFDWTSATAESVAADAKVLSELRAQAESHDPPLVRAAWRGDEAEVHALIKSGADLEAVSLGFTNAVTAAASEGRTAILKALLAAGAKPQGRYGWPLHSAAGAGHLEAVRLLLDAGLLADHTDAAGDTALQEAAHHGREEVVAFLLSRGANVNALNRHSKNALYFARAGGYSSIAELLIKAGAKS